MCNWYENKEFWERMSSKLFNKSYWKIAPEEIENLTKLTGIQPGSSILDLCCGPGRHSIELALGSVNLRSRIMKRLIIFTLLIILFSNLAFASEFSSTGIKIGLNYSKFIGDDTPGKNVSNIPGFAIGGFALVLGFAMFAFGAQLFMTANARAISKYAATEAAPAVSITTEAVASGLSKGLKGSNIGLGSSDREVIRVKCRNCGYLETEDAEFCSKCGKQV